jgi:hypothetical protein
MASIDYLFVLFGTSIVSCLCLVIVYTARYSETLNSVRNNTIPTKMVAKFYFSMAQFDKLKSITTLWH